MLRGHRLIAMRLMIRVLLASLLAAHCSAALAEHGPVVRLCYKSEDAYPFTLKNGRGIILDMLDQIGRRKGIEFRLSPMPWTRCLAEASAGVQDGVIGTFHTPERGKQFAFPLKSADEADPRFRFGEETFYVYRLASNPLQWDGQTFHPLRGMVGAQAGHLALPKLKQMGIPSDGQSVSVEDLLNKLDRGLIVAAILPEGQVNWLQKQHPESKLRIEKLETPFLTGQKHLAFSKDFYAMSNLTAQTIWQEIASLRDSQEYRKIASRYPL